MNYIIKNCLIIAILLIGHFLFAQNVTLQYQDPDLNEADNWETSDIVSDFGLRDRERSRFHKGIDISKPGTTDAGFSIITPVAGTVSFLKPRGYKIITIDGNQRFDFGYGHIFNDDPYPIESGDFVLLRLDGELNDYFAIFNTETEDAISDYDGSEGVGQITWPEGSQNHYNVSNTVVQHQAIAPLGGSGGFGPHIHLYLAPNPYNTPNDISNSKDPLQLIENPHPETNYSITIESVNNLTEQNGAAYFDGTSASSVQVRTTMLNIGNNGEPLGSGCDTKYESAVMDLDDVQLFAKPAGVPTEPIQDWGSTDHSKYKLFRGLYLESKMCLGARFNSRRYPALNNPANNNGSVIPIIDISYDTRIGSNVSTGIDPIAYCGDEYDDYYFADIYTRISDDDIMFDGQSEWAYINNDARLKDGDYELHVRAYDVDGGVHSNDGTTTITIDNFKPYIEKVEVHNPLGNPIYTYEWISDGTNLVLKEGGTFEYINPWMTTYIYVWTSEPLNLQRINNKEPSLKVNGKNTWLIDNVDKQFWKFKFDLNPTYDNITSGVLNFQFRGSDMNGNFVIDMPQGDGSIALTDMPYRNIDNFTNPQNLSEDETFQVNVCSEWIFVDEFSMSKSSTTSNLKSAKTTLPANDGLSSTTNSCASPNGNLPLPVSGFSFSIGGTDKNEVSFTNKSLNGIFYNWDFGDGEVSTEQNPVHTYTLDGSFNIYNVTLSVTNIAGETVKYKKPVQVGTVDKEFSGKVSDAYWEYNSEIDKYWFNFSLVENKMYTYKTMYDFGDGNISSSYSIVHRYQQEYSTKIYFPILYVYEYDQDKLRAVYSYNYDPIKIDGVPQGDLTIIFPYKDDCDHPVGNNNRVVLAGQNVNIVARIDNPVGKHTFVWQVYDNAQGIGEPKVITDFRVPTEDNWKGDGACHGFSSSVWSSVSKIYTQEGEYLIKVNVSNEYGQNGYAEYIVNVSSKIGCADLQITSNCRSNFKFPVNQKIPFSVIINDFSNCEASDYPGKIEWWVFKNNKPTSTRAVNYMKGYIDNPSPPSLSRCFEFYTPGRYMIAAQVYPYIKRYYHSPYDDHYPVVLNTSEYLSAVTKTIEVFDPESKVLLESYSDLDQYTNPINAGIINVCNEKGANIELPAGDNLNLVGLSEITIGPGFYATSGSEFSASIDKNALIPNCTRCPSIEETILPPHDYIPRSAVNITKDHIWNDMCKGRVEFKFHVAEKYGGPYLGNFYICSEDDKCELIGTALEGSSLPWEYERVCPKEDFYAKLYIFDNIYETSRFKVGGLGILGKPKTTDTIDFFGDEYSLEDVIHKTDIYPNPTNSKVTIELFGNTNDISSIEGYNIVGQRIFTKKDKITNQNQIDVIDWPNGIYSFRVIYKNGVIITKKLVKE